MVRNIVVFSKQVDIVLFKEWRALSIFFKNRFVETKINTYCFISLNSTKDSRLEKNIYSGMQSDGNSLKIGIF